MIDYKRLSRASVPQTFYIQGTPKNQIVIELRHKKHVYLLPNDTSDLVCLE